MLARCAHTHRRAEAKGFATYVGGQRAKLAVRRYESFIAAQGMTGSVRGAKLELPSDVPEKSYVIVICPKFGSLDGYVAWRKGQYAGIRFTDPGAATSLRPFLGESAIATVTATVKFRRRR